MSSNGMRKIVFDIETKNTFQDTGSNDPVSLDLSLVGIYDYETDSYQSFLEEDLGKLWPIFEKADMIIGFNSDHFDIPILNKYYSGNLLQIKSLDILNEIKKSLGRRVSLSQVAEATLGKGKLGKGLDAIKWWKDGDIESLRKYCLEDVLITKEVYDYALLNKSLKYKESGSILSVPIDVQSWEKKEDGSMTFSLPF